jgi:phosphatidylserine decarboxylase
MKIHREGIPIIIITILMITGIVLIINYYHPTQGAIHYVCYLALTSLLVFIIRFFRNPNRPLTIDQSTVISPADGKIVEIAETDEPEFFGDKRLKISIFMSPNNVHKNWYPISGTVRFFKHHPGKFLVAWHPKSSDLNERTTIVLENNREAKILVRQIAGEVAQRIKCYAENTKTVNQGDELGFIKFGSRVDLFLPLGTEILVTQNQKVKGCQTVIAKL